MIRVLAAITAVAALAGCSVPPGEYERYRDRCHELGGFVSKRSDDWHGYYNCVGQTSQPQLPELVRS